MFESNVIEDYYTNNNNNNNNEFKKVPFPYEITKVDPVINAELLNNFTGERTGFVQVGPKKWFFPSGYEKEAENLYNFQPRPDDVWINTFPRSGTTWTQEMVWLLANDLDYEKAAATPLEMRFPFLEYSCFVHPKVKQEFLNENVNNAEYLEIIEQLSTPTYKFLNNSTKRRFIKTHLPFCLLSQNLFDVGCKVIYVARNPKDVAVSFYHLNRSIRSQGFTGNFSQYWNYFEKNLQPWTPYWEHLNQGWRKRNEENMLFIFYEEMNKNLKQSIKKISNFLGKTYEDQEITQLENHLKIENFRQNTSVNSKILKDLGILVNGEQGFVRNGKTGGWRDYFTEGLNERADKWIEDNLKNTDLRFPVF